MQKRNLLLEVCANGLQSALNAEAGGADRIELCEQLEVGGITPRYDIIQSVKEGLSIPVHLLIRPREGDFIYSDEEFEMMKRDIEFCKKSRLDGIVFGILKRGFTVDVDRCEELMQLAKPLSVTFHRAFDAVKDPFQSLQKLIELGVDRILTSGQKENILDGAMLLHQLNHLASGKITILAGGGITEENISELIIQSGTNEFHFSAKVKLADGSLVSDVNRIRNIKEIAEKTFYGQ